MASKPFYCWFRASSFTAFLASVKWHDDDDTDDNAFSIAGVLMSLSFHNYLSLSWLFIQYWITSAYFNVSLFQQRLNCGAKSLKCSYGSKYFLVSRLQMIIEILLFCLNRDLRVVWDSVYTAGVARSKISNKPYPRYINNEN